MTSSSCCSSQSVFRTYKIPDFSVEVEREFLKKYDVENWQELLDITRSKWNSIFSLLRHFDDDAKMDGYSINRIAENLMTQPMNMLHDLCELVGHYTVCEPGLEPAE